MAIYLKYGALKGSANTKGFEGWIDVDSFSWGVQRHMASAHRGGANREAGEVAIQDITLSKRMDVSSNPLLGEAWGGKLNTKVTIKFTTNTAKGVGDFLIYELENTGISHYGISAHGQGGGSGGDLMPTETLTLNFAKISVTYKNVDPGISMSPSTVGYDLTKMVAS